MILRWFNRWLNRWLNRSFSATKLQKHELSTKKICKKLRFSSLSRTNFPGVSE